MASQSFAEQMHLSTTLVNTLKEHLTEMPHLAGLHQQLEAVITEGRTLEDLKGLHTAQLRDTNAQRRELDKRGRELRLRLASALKAAFGPDNLKLLEFGLKPRAVVVRRRRTTTPEGPGVEDRTTAQ